MRGVHGQGSSPSARRRPTWAAGSIMVEERRESKIGGGTEPGLARRVDELLDLVVGERAAVDPHLVDRACEGVPLRVPAAVGLDVPDHEAVVVDGQADLFLWDGKDLARKLKNYPAIVEDFFGPAWREAFCG